MNTPLICSLLIVAIWVYGKIKLFSSIGKTLQELDIPKWRMSFEWALFSLLVSVVLLVGVGFWHDGWHWPQIVWLVVTTLGSVMILVALGALKAGLCDKSLRISYGIGDLFGDISLFLVYYFGHVFGPLGLNPWPM